MDIEMTGKVWLVGAGPGDEGLLTVKGRDVLRSAQVVVYDRLIGEELLLIPSAGAEFIDAGKRAGNHTLGQEEINRLLVEKAKEGKRVVRLKGGDPFIFGRGGEELLELKSAGIPFEVVPGVTSAAAVPAYAGIPVTHRDCASSLHIITAHKKRGCAEPPDYKALAALPHATLVFLMGVSAAPDICAGLIRAGKPADTPAAAIEKGTMPGQRMVLSDLATLPDRIRQESIGTPGIIVVGEVCGLARDLSWREKRPLDGARIFITRPAQKASVLRDLLYKKGAQVIQLPCIECVPEEPDMTWDHAVREAADWDWIIFTSETAVRFFFERLRKERIDIRRFAKAKAAAVGNGTRRALAERGIVAEFVPEAECGSSTKACADPVKACADPAKACADPVKACADPAKACVDPAKACSDPTNASLYPAKACGEALAGGLGSIAARTDKMLVFKPAGLAGGVEELLESQGFDVTSVVLYRTKEAAVWKTAEGDQECSAAVVLPELNSEDLAVFASASAVRGFAACYGERINGVRAVCIGEKTAKAAKQAGMIVFVSDRADMDALVSKTVEVWKCREAVMRL